MQVRELPASHPANSTNFPAMVVFYSNERHSFASTVLEPPCTSHGDVAPGETVVCHCLQVTETTVVRAVREGGARSLCELACLTGAGGGCTACHRRLRHYINERKSAATGYVGDGTVSPSTSLGSYVG